MGTTTPGQTGSATHEVLLRHAAVAAWWATREVRTARFHHRGQCPTRTAPYGPDDPAARHVQEVCFVSGCLDLVHEIIGRVLTRLGSVDLATVDDLAAFTSRIASRELVEVDRAERTRLGFPARPTRNDGAAGRINRALEATDAMRAPWLIVLFRIMRSYPFSPRHVAGRWPVGGLVEERRTVLPGEPGSSALVRREIALVLRVARQTAGHDWVYANLILPLNAHGAGGELTEAVPGPSPDHESTILGAGLKLAYQRQRLAGLTPHVAFSRASLEVTGLPAPMITPELGDALDELEPTFGRAA